jgi:hypothetical protein
MSGGVYTTLVNVQNFYVPPTKPTTSAFQFKEAHLPSCQADGVTTPTAYNTIPNRISASDCNLTAVSQIFA